MTEPRILRIPFLGANDDACVLREWRATHGERATRGQVICILETTKTVLEVNVDEDCFLYHLVAEGDRIPEGGALGLTSGTELRNYREIASTLDSEKVRLDKGSATRKVTAKAKMLLSRHGLSLDSFLREFGNRGRLGEAQAREFIAQSSPQIGAKVAFETFPQRVGIIGGAGGGGALLIVDALLGSRRQVPVCIFDRDPAFFGKTVCGVPVVGGVDKLPERIQRNEVDAVVLAHNRDLKDRDDTYHELSRQGVRVCNVVAPEVELRHGVTMGTGNVILGRTWIGACTKMGDNNFISAGVHIEHENYIGDSVGFGPGVFTSGRVSIGNRVRLGTGIFVEPGVSVGDDAVIASGITLRTSVQDGTTVRSKDRVRI